MPFKDPLTLLGRKNATDNDTLEIGEKMPDGTIYAGTLPNTGEALYAMPQDLRLPMTWKGAVDYAGMLEAYQNNDWRLPTKDELNVFYQNRGRGFLKKTFNEKVDYFTGGYYWSSTIVSSDSAWAQRFTDGRGLRLYRSDKPGASNRLPIFGSVRLVRTGPAPQ